MSSKKKIIIMVIVWMVILSGFVTAIAANTGKIDFSNISFDVGSIGKQTISLNTVKTAKALSSQEITVDVLVSKLPKKMEYPAASISLGFDKNKLSFEGIRLGNMPVSDQSLSAESIVVPEWTCNVNATNIAGAVNAMYLDMSAGNSAYRYMGKYYQNNDILLRLTFKLKDTANVGDILELTFLDATMACIEDESKNKSLSLNNKNLIAKNAKIEIVQ